MAADRKTGDEFVRLGLISGPHGVRGWIKVRSDTDPVPAILEYQPWRVGPGRTRMRVADSRIRGRSMTVALAGVDDRQAAEALSGLEIAVPRTQLPELPAGRFYWADLVGSTVATVDGVELGTLEEMIETGANDVMRVRGERERCIPFVMDRYVRSVDPDAKRIEVEWDPDF